MGRRRLRDHPGWTVFSGFGFLLLVSGVALTWAGKVDATHGLGWGLLGALMIRPDHVVDLVRAWRRQDPPAP